MGVGIYDSKPFNMLTTGSYSLKKETGGTKEKQKWDIQHGFNKFMNGCDISDQLQGSYKIYVKSFKWWLRLFFFLLDLAIVNAYIIAKIFQPNLTHLQFRLNLATAILEKFPSASFNPKKREYADPNKKQRWGKGGQKSSREAVMVLQN